MTTVMPPEV